jgi:putative transposase
MVREKPTTGEIYHIYNRGVDKRVVFMDDVDYVRFIHDMFEFNDQNPPLQNLTYHFAPSNSKNLGQIPKKRSHEPRKFMIELMAFCLMPNHFHLMVRQKCENGVSNFMKKLGGGYTNYFNQKYKRSGALFQGKYKFEHLRTDNHFIHLPYYIHTNPLDLFDKDWRERKLKNKKAAIHFLKAYKWSSFLDYIGIKNFPSVTQREFLERFSRTPTFYEKDFKEWLSDIELSTIAPIIIEKE